MCAEYQDNVPHMFGVDLCHRTIIKSHRPDTSTVMQ